MINEVKAISPIDRETIGGIRRSSEEESVKDRLSEFKSEIGGGLRGVDNRLRQAEARLRQVQDQLSYLTDQVLLVANLLTAIETGVRTQEGRKAALDGYVKGCGRGGDDA